MENMIKDAIRKDNNENNIDNGDANAENDGDNRESIANQMETGTGTDAPVKIDFPERAKNPVSEFIPGK